MFQNEYEAETLTLEKSRLGKWALSCIYYSIMVYIVIFVAISTTSDARGENDIKFPIEADFNIFDIDVHSEGFPEIVYLKEEVTKLYNNSND